VWTFFVLYRDISRSRAYFCARFPKSSFFLTNALLSRPFIRAWRLWICVCLLTFFFSLLLLPFFALLSFVTDLLNNVSSSWRKTSGGESRRCRSATHPPHPHHPVVQKRKKLGKSVLGFDSRRQGEAIKGQRPGSHADEEVASDGSQSPVRGRYEHVG